MVSRGGARLRVERGMMDSTGFLSRKHRVLMVDDHPVVRYGYVQLIGQEADMEVCGEAAGVTNALRMAEVQRPDAAIVDISAGR